MITDGVFVVDTTADSGPGSLRQAILDSNTRDWPDGHDRFRHPRRRGPDHRTPHAPACDHGLRAGRRYDSAGFCRHAADRGERPRRRVAPPRLIHRGLPTSPFAAWLVGSIRLRRDQRSESWSRRSTPQGLTTQLSLLDSQGQVLVQSDGLSSSDPDDLIAQQLVSGSYFLKVDSTGGAGTYTLTTTVTPTTAPFQPICRSGTTRMPSWRATSPATAGLDLAVANAAGQHDVGAAGQRRRHVPAPGHLRGRVVARTPSWRVTSPATATSTWPSPTEHDDTRVGAAGQRRRHVPAPGHLRGRDRTQTPSWRATSPATATSTWPSPTAGDNTVSVLLGNGDGTFQPQVTYAVGSGPDAIVAGDFTGDGHLDLAVANTARRRHGVGAAGQRRRHVPAPGHLRGRVRAQMRSWRGTSAATAASTWPSPTLRQHGVGAAGQRRRHVPAPGHLRGRVRALTPSWRATSPATATSTWPSPISGTATRRVDAAGQRRRHVPTRARNGERGRVGPGRHRGGGLQRRRPDSTWPSSTTARNDTVSVLLGNGDGTFQPQVTYAVGVGP